MSINGMSVGFNTIHLEKKVGNLAAVVSMYRKIINVDAIFVTFVNNSSYTVIGRSRLDHIHIGKIMYNFGGGGHAGAGSATIRYHSLIY